MDGAQQLFLVVVSQSESDSQDNILGRAVLLVSSHTICTVTYFVFIFRKDIMEKQKYMLYVYFTARP